MKSKEEIKQWLLENAVNEYGYVDLSYIEFGELTVYFRGVKANNITNSYQKANNIHNRSQKANHYIYNSSQKANNIYNSSQKANNIDNSSQEANNITNSYQEATKYFNTHNAVIDGVQYEVDITDGIYVIVHKKSTYNGVTFIKGETIIGDTIYLYKNNLVSYHGITKQNAKEGFKRKLEGFTVKQEIIDEIKSTQRITRKQYHELTGACDMGIQAFAERIGMVDREYLTLTELAELLKPNDYGYNYIKQWGVIE